MSNGRIDAELQQSAVEEVYGLLAQVAAKLPFLLRLNNDEKLRLVKPHPGARQVIESIHEVGVEAGMAPTPTDPMLTDLSVFVGLTSISDRITDLLQLVEDTRLLAGSEAWNEGLIRYAILRQRQRAMPELRERLDRIQPLITSRGTRPDYANESDGEPADGEPAEAV